MISMNEPPHFYRPAQDEVIYHYAPLDAAHSIVRNGNIWLSDFEKTNDFKEFVWARDIYLDQLKKNGGPLELSLLVAAAIGGINRHTKMMIGSFSSEPDDLTQWRTYADDGQGCVLGFSASWMERYSGTTARKIVYEEQAIRDLSKYGLEMLLQEYGEQKQVTAELKLLAQHIAADLFAFKHPSYHSEKEIRLSRIALRKMEMQDRFKPCSGTTADGRVLKSLEVKVRTSRYGITNFIELPYRSKNGNALVSIGLGPRATQAAGQELACIVKKFSPKVITWTSEIPMR
jgi:hypothetical protein